MIVIAPRPFAEDFAITAALERALAPHTIHIVADPAPEADLVASGEILVTGFEHQRCEAIEFVLSMPRLRWIHSLTAGLGSVASMETVDRGILVSSGAGVFAGPIAEFALASLIMLARGLPELVLAGGSRSWAAGHPLGWELAGRRTGVIGYGGIGRRVAELLAGVGMRVGVVTRTPESHRRGSAESVTGLDGLPRLLEESDALVVCASLNPTSVGLLGPDELARCKPGAVLVNVARGQLVDEPALARALRAGTLAGAVIDVTATEPLPPDSPLWEVPNLWITPHLAGGTVEGRARMLDRFAVNLPLFAAGRVAEMVSVVDVRREIVTPNR